MSRSPYQVLPDLTPEEYASLRESVAQHGVVVPIVVDEHGQTIDGHNRQTICKELDLKGRVPFVAILVVVLVFAVVFSDPPRILLLAFLVYAASGPIQYLLRLRRDKTLP